MGASEELYHASLNGYVAKALAVLGKGPDVNFHDKNGWTPLLNASMLGHTAIVELLLAAGASVDLAWNTMATPLSMASQKGHTAIVEQLLAAGATVDLANCDNATPLFLASKNGHAAIVRLLLAAGASVDISDNANSTPLFVASQQGHTAIVQRLLAAGAAVDLANNNNTTPLLIASELGHTAIVDQIIAAGATVDLSGNNNATPLLIASQQGHAMIVELLLAAGANCDLVNTLGESALIAAALNSHEYVARIIVAASTDRHARHSAAAIFEDKGNEAAAAFFWGYETSPSIFFDAAQRGDLALMQRVANEIDVTCVDEHSRTPLHVAARHGLADIVQLLVQQGAILDVRDDQGRTPLHLACARGDLASVEFLMDNGALHEVADTKGLTPGDWAARYGRLPVVQALVARGEKLTNVTSDGRTILHHAVLSHNAALVDYVLRQESADVNALDADGSSPLHYAVGSLEEDGASVSAPPNVEDLLAVLPRLLAVEGIDLDAQNRKGETALLLACERGDESAVQLLLNQGVRADIADLSDRTPLSVAATKDIHSAVHVYHNSQQYHDRSFALLHKAASRPTLSQLSELVPLITSVYDLRFLLTLVSRCDDDNVAARNAVLNAAFEHTVANKLTFDDHACVFFKLVLEHCERENLLSREAFLLFDRQAEKVNTASAEWVLELQKHVHSNSWRLDTHAQHLRSLVDEFKQAHAMIVDNRKAIQATAERVENLQSQVRQGRELVRHLMKQARRMSAQMSSFDERLTQSDNNIKTVAAHLTNFQQAYVSRFDQEKRNSRIKFVCGVVASIAGFVLGPVLKQVSDKIVDFMNPIAVATSCGIKDLTNFLLAKTAEKFPDVIQSRLEKHAIPPNAFEELLREGIVLTHPEIVDKCAQGDDSIVMLLGSAELDRSDEQVLEIVTNAASEVFSELHAALEGITVWSNPSFPQTLSGDMKWNRSWEERVGARVGNNSPPAEEGRLKSPLHAPPPVNVPLLSRVPKKESNPTTSKLDTSNQHAIENQQKSSATAERLVNSVGNSTNVVIASDPGAFPYHVAVEQCAGDVPTFKALMTKIDNNADPHASMEMLVAETITTEEKLCAAQYAYLVGYHAVGDAIRALMVNPPDFDREPATSVSLDGDLDEFPYVLAVTESGGDVDAFEDYMLAFKNDEHALEDEIHAIVTRERSSKVSWTVYEYASHLGNVGLVQYLFQEVCRGVSAKTRINTIKHARARGASQV